MTAVDPNAEAPMAEEPPSETELLRSQIEDTREELGETVEALAHKTDVKAQVNEKVDEKREEAKAKVEEKREEAKAKVDEKVDQAKSRIDDLGSKAEDAQAKLAQSPPVQQARERPWLVVAAGATATLLLVAVLRRRR